MLVSVAICTWNRSRLLDLTLRSMRSLRIPDGVDWELLVVDNNSTDQTREVVSQHAATLPIRFLFEEKQGHSNARNRALAEAQGDLMLWTDDDVQVEKGWLAEYASAYERYPDAGYFGGPVRPWFEVAPPAWLADQYRLVGWPWALIDSNRDEGLLAAEEPVFGANMGFRTPLLRKYAFDPNLGHVGLVPRGGDEVSLQIRIQQDGGAGVWLPKAVVQHYVVPERMTLSFVRRRAFEDGKSSYQLEDYGSKHKLFGVPRWMIRQYAKAQAAAWAGRMTGSRTWLSPFVRAARMRGIMAAARGAQAGENELS